MHIFEYSPAAVDISPELVGPSNILFDLRARNNLRMQEDASTFEHLREAAMVESVRGSNAIEGIVTTQERLAEIVSGTSRPRSRNEREILGYRNALQEMYAPGFSESVSEEYIRHLHQLIKEESSPEAGEYKRENNVIREIDADGRSFIRFAPTHAKDVPDAMNQLMLAYHDARQSESLSPLFLIPCVIVDFLCIHPFSDGNGRVSRLLTTMLLQRAGFDIGRYISIEGMIDKHRAAYYDALQDSSEGWHTNENDYSPFVTLMMQILYACYKELDLRFEKDALRRVSKSERVERLLRDAYVPISKADIRERLPEVSVKTIEATLSKLVKDGTIEKIGTYRDARYRRM